jgi:predicted PurR-regulated permease PerM
MAAEGLARYDVSVGRSPGQVVSEKSTFGRNSADPQARRNRDLSLTEALLVARATAIASWPLYMGYAAVAAMALQLTLQGLSATALLVVLLGCAVLLGGDKVVRPMVARGGVRQPFVWVLMGCISGFGLRGLSGLVIGPVVLSLFGELWDQRAREAAG